MFGTYEPHELFITALSQIHAEEGTVNIRKILKEAEDANLNPFTLGYIIGSIGFDTLRNEKQPDQPVLLPSDYRRISDARITHNAGLLEAGLKGQ